MCRVYIYIFRTTWVRFISISRHITLPQPFTTTPGLYSRGQQPYTHIRISMRGSPMLSHCNPLSKSFSRVFYCKAHRATTMYRDFIFVPVVCTRFHHHARLLLRSRFEKPDFFADERDIYDRISRWM